MRVISPLRYPGGKAGLAGFLEQVIELNDLQGCAYFEPFAGGAGAALKLLANGIVEKIHLNDADPRIYAFWYAALNDTSRFIERIFTVPLTLDEWKQQRAIYDAGQNCEKLFDLGFSAFYMNRCNRSGILKGAGPIGGYGQNSRWGIDARFSRDNLAERIHWIGKMRNHITLHCEDAVCFLKRKLPRGRGRKVVFVYLDPPYVGKGGRLYMNNFDESDHEDLAAYMNNQRSLRWIMSYDDHELIRTLYDMECSISNFSLGYSLQKRTKGEELLIAPRTLNLPHSIRCRGNEELLMEVS